jgi:hypothetical protein
MINLLANEGDLEALDILYEDRLFIKFAKNKAILQSWNINKPLILKSK